MTGGALGPAKHRVEALNDGIYAVAMTLLVLELKIPGSTRLDDEAAFAAQRAFHFLRAVDSRLLWVNLFALLFASLLPFSSALGGEHPFFSAQVFYAANMAALALLAIAQISYVEKHPELCHAPVPPHIAREAREAELKSSERSFP
jgi:uncharacterized membrane protein